MESADHQPSSGEGEYKPSKEGEELAKAFEAGINWLASQRDPFNSFKQHLSAGLMASEAKRMVKKVQGMEANQQFEEIAKTGHVDAARVFDIMEGLFIRNVSPDSFFKILQGYAAKKHAEAIRLQTEKEARKKEQMANFEKFMKPDFLNEIRSATKNSSKNGPEKTKDQKLNLNLSRKFKVGLDGQIVPVFEGDLKNYAEYLLKKMRDKDGESKKDNE